MECRRKSWRQPPPRFERSYGGMFAEHVARPTRAATSTFWRRSSAATAGEPDIF